MNLEKIFSLFSSKNVCDVYIKFLAENDNSKNQIYLGAEEFVHVLPATKTTLKVQFSKKKKAREFIFTNHLDFSWLTQTDVCRAPNTKLIFYPQYPEVRLSGFLSGCSNGPSELLGKRTTQPRVLFFGSDVNGKSYGFVKELTVKLKREIQQECVPWKEARKNEELKFFVKQLYKEDPVQSIVKAIRKIHQKGWIKSCRMKDGVIIPYNARNGGGYTIEAHLGISPNGRSEPDYMGWEVKQHSQKTSVITLMTPDPDKGFAAEQGTKEFVKKYGYKDRSGKENRVNFGGIYRNNIAPHHLTGLTLKITGYENGEITDSKGSISLVDKKGEKVAIWSFEKIMVHWTRKHYKAVFIPSEQRIVNKEVFYRYSNKISLGQNSKFVKFLELVEKGLIYLDPALKVELNDKGKEEIKTRYQFRIRKKDASSLYLLFQELEL